VAAFGHHSQSVVHSAARIGLAVMTRISTFLLTCRSLSVLCTSRLAAGRGVRLHVMTGYVNENAFIPSAAQAR